MSQSPQFVAPKPSEAIKPKAKQKTEQLEVLKFERKSFPVGAIQITPENMEAVANWCAGTIMHDGEKEGHLSRDYIKVRVAYPMNERQTQAYLGDWVLKSGKSFKVYTNSAFEKSFRALS